jgi:hypothetical protein
MKLFLAGLLAASSLALAAPVSADPMGGRDDHRDRDHHRHHHQVCERHHHHRVCHWE